MPDASPPRLRVVMNECRVSDGLGTTEVTLSFTLNDRDEAAYLILKDIVTHRRALVLMREDDFADLAREGRPFEVGDAVAVSTSGRPIPAWSGDSTIGVVVAIGDSSVVVHLTNGGMVTLPAVVRPGARGGSDPPLAQSPAPPSIVQPGPAPAVSGDSPPGRRVTYRKPGV